MPAPAGQLPSLHALLRVFWPGDLPGLRLRFGGTIALLASAAAINALVPLLFAALVDRLSGTHAVAAAPAAILAGYVEEDLDAEELVRRGLPADDVERVIRMVDRAECKRRQAPPGIKVSTKAFGRDRRLPITNRYAGRAETRRPRLRALR